MKKMSYGNHSVSGRSEQPRARDFVRDAFVVLKAFLNEVEVAEIPSGCRVSSQFAARDSLRCNYTKVVQIFISQGFSFAKRLGLPPVAFQVSLLRCNYTKVAQIFISQGFIDHQ